MSFLEIMSVIGLAGIAGYFLFAFAMGLYLWSINRFFESRIFLVVSLFFNLHGV